MDKNDNNEEEEDSRQDFVLKSISRIIDIFRENDFNERKKKYDETFTVHKQF